MNLVTLPRLLTLTLVGLLPLALLVEAEETTAPRCPHDTEPIVEFETVDKLLAEYESMEDNEACRDLWLEPLQELKDVLEVTREDICSESAVEALSRFHWKWVVGTIEKSWRLASKKPTPGAVRIFFMHYADELADRCRDNAGKRLEQAIKELKITTDEAHESLSTGSLGGLIRRLKLALIPQDEVQRYDDFFLLWNSLLDMQRKKGRPLPVGKFNSLTGEQVYAALKVKDPHRAASVQDKCRRELRPIYARTTLPLMQLTDMGYGHMGVKIVGQDNLSRLSEWYAFTQLCELILPIHFKATEQDHQSDDSQPTGAAIVTREQLQYLPNALPAEKPVTKVEPIQFGETRLANPHDLRVGKRIKSTIDSRGRIYRRVFWNVLRAIKSELKSAVREIFFSGKKSPGTQVVDQLKIVRQEERALESAIHEAEQDLREEEERVAEELRPASARRRRRRRKREYNTALEEFAGTVDHVTGIVTVAIFVAILVWAVMAVVAHFG